METVLLVDGQNFKKNAEKILEEEGILDAKEVLKEGRAYKKMERPDWCLFDFEGLLSQVLEGLEVNSKFFYLSKIISYPQTKEKSEQLIKEQRLLLTHLKRQGFQPLLAGNVRGYFEERDGKIHATFREKGVDVRIAVDMIKMALLEKVANTIILVSSDSDLQPAIREIRKRGETHLIYLGFERDPNIGLSHTTHRTITIRNSEVIAFYKKQLKIVE